MVLHNVLLAAEGSAVGFSDIKPVLDALAQQISVSTIVSVLAGIVGVCIGIVFMWWAVRKAVGAIFSAFRDGKQSI